MIHSDLLRDRREQDRRLESMRAEVEEPLVRSGETIMVIRMDSGVTYTCRFPSKDRAVDEMLAIDRCMADGCGSFIEEVGDRLVMVSVSHMVSVELFPSEGSQ